MINNIKTEIQNNQYRDETAAMVANIFFYNASGTTKNGYHIEFSFDDLNTAQNFAQILAQYDMFPKLIERNERFVIYLKSGECVCNLLALIGAKKSLMELHNEIALRALRNNTNRRANCDTANIAKQVNTATAQIEQLKALTQSDKFKTLDKKLKDTAISRIENPELSYEELSNLLGITKSGVVNRLKKLLTL